MKNRKQLHRCRSQPILFAPDVVCTDYQIAVLATSRNIVGKGTNGLAELVHIVGGRGAFYVGTFGGGKEVSELGVGEHDLN